LCAKHTPGDSTELSLREVELMIKEEFVSETFFSAVNHELTSKSLYCFKTFYSSLRKQNTKQRFFFLFVFVFIFIWDLARNGSITTWRFILSVELPLYLLENELKKKCKLLRFYFLTFEKLGIIWKTLRSFLLSFSGKMLKKEVLGVNSFANLYRI
jgi:hypothetical protein